MSEENIVANTPPADGPPGSPPGTITIKVDAELLNNFQTAKGDIERLFKTRDFENAVKKSEEAIQLAKQLPPPIGVPEIIQIQVNLSTAFLHMNKLAEAENCASASVLTAELNVTQRGGHPQAVEILTVALGCKSVAALSGGKIDDAYDAAQKALTLCENIYQKNDPRLHKSLRTVGLIQDKKGNTAEAERTLIRAYTILAVAGGAHSPEAQILIDDLVGLFMRKQDLENAERYARMNYKTISDKKSSLSERELPLLADSATRLASLLVKKGDMSGAESLVAEALAIRDTPQYMSMNPMGVAYSLTQLVGCREELGKLGNENDQEIETMLLRAIDIFSRVRGHQCPEVMNSLQQLRRIRMKKQEGGSNGGNNANATSSSSSSSAKKTITSDDAEDDLQYSVTSENKAKKSPLPAAAGGSLAAAKSFHDTANKITKEDFAKIQAIPADDGISRMQLANIYFETAKYHVAEILIEQALQIFLQQFGPEHQNVAAAKQNLSAVRNNRINQLWLQVVTEEVLSIQETKNGGPSDGTSNTTSKEEESNDKEGAYSRALKKGNQAVASAANLSFEEKVFLSSLNTQPTAAGNGCVIC